MFQCSDLVIQDETCLNGKNKKDNKPYRLNVVLFEIILDDTLYVCTCPITSNKKGNLTNYYYEGYMLLGKNRLSYIKLNSADLYQAKILHKVNINMGEERMKKVLKKLENVELITVSKATKYIIKQEILKLNKPSKVKKYIP